MVHFLSWMKYNRGMAEVENSFRISLQDVKAHLITTAKGMGNGFPVGGVLIHPDIKPWSGMLGTTFGGNYLVKRCQFAVLEVMEKEKLIENAAKQGSIF
jgi:acetylornithine/N-succinyldiaminopimelate aminotransferase